MAGEGRQSPPRTGNPAPGGLDTSVPHIARVYDYWLGGKDNFAVDREAAEQVMAAYPGDLARCPRAAGVFGSRGGIPGGRGGLEPCLPMPGQGENGYLP